MSIMDSISERAARGPLNRRAVKFPVSNTRADLNAVDWSRPRYAAAGGPDTRKEKIYARLSQMWFSGK